MYTPGADDPGIRFWATKAGAQTVPLFWTVDASTTAAGGVCDQATPGFNVFNLDCLNAAQVVTSGPWTSPVDDSLSNIVFFNERPAAEVPEPATLALLGIGLLGAGYMARRRRDDA